MIPTNREKELIKIKRWHKFPVMFYRSDVYIHSRRMCWLIDELSNDFKKIYPNIDIEKLKSLALIHDDPEIITTDISAYTKERFTKEEENDLKNREIEAANKLALKYSSDFQNDNYQELLNDAINIHSIESKIMKLIDKLDGLGEVLHEINNNNLLYEKGYTHTGNDLDIPLNFFIPKIQNMLNSVPELGPILSSNIPQIKEIITIVHNQSKRFILQHSRSDIIQKTEKFYNFWILSQRNHANGFELNYLTIQTEFLDHKILHLS